MRDAMTPAYFVPQGVKADVLFRNMKEKHEYFAVVLDEYGGLHGIVTLTDLVECIVGEFTETDEEAEAEQLIQESEDGKWEINGTAPISEVEEALAIQINDEDSDTFGGYVLGLYGSIPEDGSTFELSTEQLHIVIESIKDHKIERAIVEVISEDEDKKDRENAG
jgi:putative hemolysin